jgi:hypothetical protein
MDSVVVEVTGSSGNYIDSIVIDDEADLHRYLTGFIGTEQGDPPSLLEWLNEDGEIIGSEPVLYGLRDGVPFAWRTIH